MPSQATRFLMLAVLAMTGLAACAGMRIDTSSSPALDPQSAVAVLALANNTSTPYAGQRVQQQLAALLTAHGVGTLSIEPSAASGPLPVGNDAQDMNKALAWARAQQARYALTGSVDEWRYKIGLDGQPAVGFTLRLIDLGNGKTVWSGAASASGHSREGLAVLSQHVLDQLVMRLLRKSST